MICNHNWIYLEKAKGIVCSNCSMYKAEYDEDNKVQYNIKPRLVECENCKIRILTDEPGPKCKLCGNNMITLPRNEQNDSIQLR